MAVDNNDQIIEIPGVGQVAFPASMPDAEISKAAARLHREAQQESNRSTPTGAGLVGAGATLAAQSAPAIVSGINRAASIAPGMAAGVRTGGRAVTAGAAAGEAFRGNFKNAAGIAASDAALEAVPSIARRIAEATAPARQTASSILGPSGAALTGTVAPGALARIASLISRAAGPIGIAATVGSTFASGQEMNPLGGSDFEPRRVVEDKRQQRRGTRTEQVAREEVLKAQRRGKR